MNCQNSDFTILITFVREFSAVGFLETQRLKVDSFVCFDISRMSCLIHNSIFLIIRKLTGCLLCKIFSYSNVAYVTIITIKMQVKFVCAKSNE